MLEKVAYINMRELRAFILVLISLSSIVVESEGNRPLPVSFDEHHPLLTLIA